MRSICPCCLLCYRAAWVDRAAASNASASVACAARQHLLPLEPPLPLSFMSAHQNNSLMLCVAPPPLWSKLSPPTHPLLHCTEIQLLSRLWGTHQIKAALWTRSLFNLGSSRLWDSPVRWLHQQWECLRHTRFRPLIDVSCRTRANACCLLAGTIKHPFGLFCWLNLLQWWRVYQELELAKALNNQIIGMVAASLPALHSALRSAVPFTPWSAITPWGERCLQGMSKV